MSIGKAYPKGRGISETYLIAADDKIKFKLYLLNDFLKAESNWTRVPNFENYVQINPGIYEIYPNGDFAKVSSESTKVIIRILVSYSEIVYSYPEMTLYRLLNGHVYDKPLALRSHLETEHSAFFASQGSVTFRDDGVEMWKYEMVKPLEWTIVNDDFNFKSTPALYRIYYKGKLFLENKLFQDGFTSQHTTFSTKNNGNLPFTVKLDFNKLHFLGGPVDLSKNIYYIHEIPSGFPFMFLAAEPIASQVFKQVNDVVIAQGEDSFHINIDFNIMNLPKMSDFKNENDYYKSYKNIRIADGITSGSFSQKGVKVFDLVRENGVLYTDYVKENRRVKAEEFLKTYFEPLENEAEDVFQLVMRFYCKIKKNR